MPNSLGALRTTKGAIQIFACGSLWGAYRFLKSNYTLTYVANHHKKDRKKTQSINSGDRFYQLRGGGEDDQEVQK